MAFKATAGVIAALLLAARAANADCDARPGASTCLTSDALWPKPGPQRFAYVSSAELPQPGRFAVALVSTWQKRPIDLHVATPGPRGTDAAAIDDQVDTTLATSFGITDRLAAWVAIPATLYETGGGVSPASGGAAPATSSLRDPRIGGGFTIVPRRLTGLFEVQIPTHSTTDFAGEQGIVLAPAIAGDVRFGRFIVGAELGARIRPVPQSFFGERQATQGILGAGVSIGVLPRELLAIGLETHALVGFDARADVHQDRFGLTTTNARTILGGEWLASLRSGFAADTFSVLAGGGGTMPLDGLVGIGRVRFVLGFAYTPSTIPPPVIVPAAEPEVLPATPREPRALPARVPKPVPAPRPAPGTCATTCVADSYSALPKDDQTALASRTTPFLQELRSCLERVGGERIRPAIIVRFSDDGTQLDVRLDLGGYEDISCAKDARTHVPVYSASRGTTARCELRCE